MGTFWVFIERRWRSGSYAAWFPALIVKAYGCYELSDEHIVILWEYDADFGNRLTVVEWYVWTCDHGWMYAPPFDIDDGWVYVYTLFIQRLPYLDILFPSILRAPIQMRRRRH